MASSVEINCRISTSLNLHAKEKLFFPSSDIKTANRQNKKMFEKTKGDTEEKNKTYRAEKQFYDLGKSFKIKIGNKLRKLEMSDLYLKNLLENNDRPRPFLDYSNPTRKKEAAAIRNKFPTKIPIIVDRFHKESSLPQLERSKFLVPQEITMSQFVTIIRNRMKLGSNQAFYLLINNRSMLSLSKTLAEVYNDHKEEDGFLYMTYASQEVFG